jgi:hypothetical protein
MDVSEWLGFFIVLVSVIFIVGQWMYSQLERARDPEGYKQKEERQRERLAFLMGEVTPSPKKKNLKKKEKLSEAPKEDRGFTTEYDLLAPVHDAYLKKRARTSSRARCLLKNNGSFRQAFLIKEILSRPEERFWNR